ncbi:hypothetical protein [Microcoleus sp. D3_18_C4]|uniref:hypothetical protein n=1 Tax=Microcoleus sp. D3_18_C4 TaxID=3055335 RepID=UPI002FD57799
MEPVTLTAIATLVLIKATEKAAEKLGEQVVEKGGKLLSLLKPSTVSAIELSQQQPLNYGKAVLELNATTDPKVIKAVEDLCTAVKANPRIAKLVEDQVNTLSSESQSTSNYTNVAKQQVNIPQGPGASVYINEQTNHN